ncbi:hypothetical protein E0H75_23295 [Kribbella capetownensis]|uniref:Uncharacterized protein n=1 Tax=Kribbella capetownensis TaxID=1572659 RepID=A0A4R0JKL5_9ACTN|nr:hypothetical protein [Kribbella capetownensis]TCC47683.1 hypothetical protein E0H75_23295 [Kribbella capetownensis]
MGESSSTILVVTAMPLSAAARADLSAMLGEQYAVVDIKEAPSTANILLTPVVSGQLLGSLRALFPTARILYTELHDDGRGISFSGPLSRIAAQGPDGYFVAHALDSLAPIVRSEAKLQLAGSARRTPPRIAGSPQPPTVHPSTEASSLEPGPDEAAVLWIDRAGCAVVPPGSWLDLDPIDELVTRVVGASDPRGDVLWAVVVAECAVRLMNHHQENVLVDVGELTAPILAELQIRVSSELINQLTWPS